MSQALGNVIDNALRHTQADGQVEVAATLEAGRQLTISGNRRRRGDQFLRSASHCGPPLPRRPVSQPPYRRRRPGAGNYARSRRSTRGYSFRFPATALAEAQPCESISRCRSKETNHVQRNSARRTRSSCRGLHSYTGCTFRCDKIGAGVKITGCVGTGARVNTVGRVRSGAGGQAVLTGSEGLADCPGGYLRMLPGQSAFDPTADDIPAYIDIVGVDSSLDGETLTAVFSLRDIPEEMEFNREGVKDLHSEYMWTIEIFRGEQRRIRI